MESKGASLFDLSFTTTPFMEEKNKKALFYIAWITSVSLALGVGYWLSLGAIKESVKKELSQEGKITTNSSIPPPLDAPISIEQRRDFFGKIIAVNNKKIQIQELSTKDGSLVKDSNHPIFVSTETLYSNIDSGGTANTSGVFTPPIGKFEELKAGLFVIVRYSLDKDKNIVAESLSYSSSNPYKH